MISLSSNHMALHGPIPGFVFFRLSFPLFCVCTSLDRCTRKEEEEEIKRLGD
jgi:hypothetical protein